MNTPGKRAGFSLIELLVAITIIGILSSIALPMYDQYITESRRLDAHVALRSAAQSMERCKTENFSYTGCVVPPTSPEAHYAVAVVIAGDGRSYSVTATADSSGIQSSDSDCTTLSINHAGVTTAADSSGSASPACW